MGRAELRALAEALAWQIELGADEALAERPVDRLAAAPPPASARRATTAAPVAPAGPRGGPPARPVAPSAGTGGTAGPPPAVRTAAEVAGAARTLDELAAALAAWEGSELRAGARRCVFADGRPGARVMVIGEAPGSEEDRRGLPFVGRAGRLLDRMLAAVGLSRGADDLGHAVYISNILPWRPPGNRTPSEAEAALFLPFVERHIALAEPEVLLLLGNTPTKALLGTETGIRRMRGRWRRHGASGLPALPSFHPAYLLRQPAEKAAAWADLLALCRALAGEGPEIGAD